MKRVPAMSNRIDRGRIEPAYSQLAAILRRRISEGVYPPGEKIPSEFVMSKEYGLSLMTVRQAIGVLTRQGLLERLHGTGTFVKSLKLTECRFTLDRLEEIFKDDQRTRVKILELSLVRADAETAEVLCIQEGSRAILIRRLLSSCGRPILLHRGHVRCEPTRPLVEAELGLGPFSDLFNGSGGETAKKGALTLVPSLLGGEESVLLGSPPGAPAFRMDYVVYDFDDVPFGCGSFTALSDTLQLKTKLGLWEED
jgi:GntR family transcriptional regulator